MAKRGSKTNPIVVTTDGLNALAALLEQKPFEIRDAHIKDDFCNYSYEITQGVGRGDVHSVKGSAIVHDDLKNAFNRFNVHLAVIDDVFKHSDIQFEDVNKMHNDELTMLFTVTGFKIKGSKENEGIILIGTKYVSGGGRIDLESPKILIDNNSTYKWYNELKVAADDARKEVLLYIGGKCTPVEVDDTENPQQMTIGDAIAHATGSIDDDFEKAAIK